MIHSYILGAIYRDKLNYKPAHLQDVGAPSRNPRSQMERAIAHKDNTRGQDLRQQESEATALATAQPICQKHDGIFATHLHKSSSRTLKLFKITEDKAANCRSHSNEICKCIAAEQRYTTNYYGKEICPMRPWCLLYYQGWLLFSATLSYTYPTRFPQYLKHVLKLLSNWASTILHWEFQIFITFKMPTFLPTFLLNSWPIFLILGS